MEVIEVIKKSFNRLKNKRFFVSEADFQQSFGLELSKSFGNDAKILMEFPVHIDGEIFYADIVILKNGVLYPIELKYKTKNIKSEDCFLKSGIKIDGLLKNQGAQDLGEYFLWKDMNRIEKIIASGKAKKGICIFITNDPYYWANSCGTETQAYHFRIVDGEKKKGKYDWNLTEADKYKKDHWTHKYPKINIRNSYNFKWEDFYKTAEKNGEFRSLLVEIHS